MKKIGVYDTSVLTMNMGDFIIMDAVNEELEDLFSDSFFIKSPSRKEISIKDLRWLRHMEYYFVGGTNLLTSKMNKFKPWKISMKETYFIKNIVLFGVGWHNYEEVPNKYTKKLLSNLTNDKNIMHSVRDEYTKEQLKKCGIDNVINTGCPTTWNLTPEHCAVIPVEKSKNVVTTITDYRKDVVNDTIMLNALIDNYEKVYVWIQGLADYKYFNELEIDHSRFELVPPRLKAYDALLDDNSIDFIGTRLHAGIRAMQFKKRAIIIGVDNRAKEIHKDININFLARENINELESILNKEVRTEISLPLDKIKLWKNQFTLI